jgi:hypothetical protein
MNKQYIKLFHGLLNIAIQNAMILYRNNMQKRTDQLSLRIQLADGLLVKIFHTCLNTSLQNAMILYRNNMQKITVQLSFRIQLAEGLFVKYTNLLEHKVSRRHSFNTVPCLTERYFISNLPPPEKKARPHRQCVVCQK